MTGHLLRLLERYERLPYWLRLMPECWVLGEAVSAVFAAGGAWGTIMVAADKARARRAT